MTIAYLPAARLGLAIITEGLPVFWPASGIAVGILVTLGRRASAAVVIGVVAATIAANAMADQAFFGAAVLKGACIAGEAVLTGRLIERWLGDTFAFDSVRRVVGFVAAAGVGAAASGIAGAAAITLLQGPMPFGGVWRAWFLTHVVGILVAAPLVIGLGQLWREPPSRAESIEGVAVLAALTIGGMYSVPQPSGAWATYDADAVVFPLLLWLTARCPPIFGIAGAFVWSMTVICAIVFGLGQFGDARIPLSERIAGAQVSVAMVTLSTLVLIALFTERRRNEATLRLALLNEEESRTRLADAMAAGRVTAFEWDAVSCCSKYCDNTLADILGFERGGMARPPRKDFISHVHPDDRASLKACIRALNPNNPSYALTFRFVRSDGRQVWLEETARGEFDANGRLLRIKGLTRDITARKELEENKSLLIAELDHRVKNMLALVSAIVVRTREASSSMAEFVTAFDGRIRSLAITHELLSGRHWHGLLLGELVRRVLAPYATTGTMRIEGSDVVLSAEAGQTIAMVLHELATNAAKFGALSVKDGCVSVRWEHLRKGDSDTLFCVWWEESGGPAVRPPTRSGYGTSTIRHLIPYELGGRVDIVYAPSGLRCTLEIPARWLELPDAGEAGHDG
ncbi:MAG TPA: HWE histidine kinase domain-containing protein [Hyphomicrobiaceae bacterium]|nr:HWE histidine kinase domain-containing protein [Hyphomicrobiaceae bacterium]